MADQRTRERPTLRTIAEETGFAVTTVSRALKDDPRIAAKTRKAVAEAAEKLAYVPDRAAQRLRTGRTKVISVLLNSSTNSSDLPTNFSVESSKRFAVRISRSA